MSFQRTKDLFKELPLDCWGRCLVFLSSSRDFFSVVKVVRGLLHYCSFDCPSSTEFIVFRFTNIPKEEKLYVTKATYNSEYDQSKSSYQMGEELERVFEVFPNLLAINLRHCEVTTRFDDNEKVKGMLGESNKIFGIEKVSHPFLKQLGLVTPCVGFILDLPLLPRLETLNLTRSFRYNPQEGFDPKAFTLDKDSWSERLPCLKTLILDLWNLDTKKVFTPDLKQSLVNLVLLFVIVDEISNFESLERLEIEGTSVKTLKRVQKCDKLKTLDITYEYEEVPIDFEIQNFPSLERLDLTLNCQPIYHKKCMHLRNLPKLTYLRIVGGDWKEGNGTCFPVKVYSVLEEIYLSEWADLSFFRGKENLKNIKKVTYYRSELPQFLKEEIHSFPKLEDLKELQIGMSRLIDTTGYYLNETSKNDDSNVLFLQGTKSERFALSAENNLFSSKFDGLFLSRSMIGFLLIRQKRRIIGCPNMNSLSLLLEYTSEIRDCPNLEHIQIIPFEGLKVSNLPKLRILELGIIEKEQIERLSFYLDKFRTFKTIKKLSLNPYYLSEIVLRGDDISMTEGLEKMKVVFIQDVNIEKIDIQNFRNLKKLELCSSSETYPHYYCLKNLPLLEELNFSSSKLPKSTEIKAQTILENMISCRTFHVSKGHSSMENITIRNVNIQTLKVYLAVVDLENDRERALKYSHEVKATEFPVLEKLVVYDRDGEMDPRVKKGEKKAEEIDVQRIGIMKNLRNLKRIEVIGKKHNFEPFVCLVAGEVDISRINIECHEFKVHGYNDFKMEDEGKEKYIKKEMKFKEYIQEMNLRFELLMIQEEERNRDVNKLNDKETFTNREEKKMKITIKR